MHRRELLAAAAATGFGLAVGPHRFAKGSAPGRSSGRLRDQALMGVDYFRRRAEEQAPLVDEMIRAIESGDVRAAQRAYVVARPPYEEIETLAADFPESDRDIDARPYVFERGEDDENFRGFHRVEVHLFADRDTEAAKPYADGLKRSVDRLRAQLGEPDRFSAASTFAGMVTLATEVAAKKISSEEETWSDQSLIIFKHNWLGIWSQYEPFAKSVAQADPKLDRAVRDAHERAMATLDGHFVEGRVAGTPYSDVRIGERRAMANASREYAETLIAAGETLRLL